MNDLLVVIVCFILLSVAIGMIVKTYLDNTKQEREYKRIAKKTRNKRKEFEERKRKQFENNKLDKEWVGMYKKELYYIIEVNKGVYLTKTQLGGYNFTDDIERSKKYSDVENAKNIAKNSGGKILYYTITHEVKWWHNT